MTWTRFMDMHSGGGRKLDWEYVYIEAPQSEAELVFYRKFGRNPNKVTCTCCGEDYSVGEAESLEQATAFERGCAYAYFRPDGTECPEKEGFVLGKGKPPGYTGRYVERAKEGYSWHVYRTLADYLTDGSVRVIRADEISPDERVGELPEQGYVWVD